MIRWVDALTVCHLILKRNDSGKSEESDVVALQGDICADIGGDSALVYSRIIEFEKKNYRTSQLLPIYGLR
jgi:hypothetical protein